MTDEPDAPMSFAEMRIALDGARAERDAAKDANARLRQTSDDNYNSAREWKALAEKAQAQIADAHRDAKAAITEAAELRGYIRRVNETDPKRYRRKDERRNSLERFAR